MKLGCSTLIYGLWSQDDALAGIKQAGFDALELCSTEGMGFHLWPERTNVKVLQKKIAEIGLIVESIGGAGNNPFDENPNSRFRQLMRVGGELGAKAVTAGSGGSSGNAEDMKRSAEGFNKLVKDAKENGIKVSVKPHVGAVVHNSDSALEFMQMVDAEWIGLNVDPSHLWRGQPTWEAGEVAIPKLAKYLVTARLRDTKGHQQGIGPVETQVPGGGEMDLQACMDAYKKVPGLEFVTTEIVGTAHWPLDKIQNEVAKPTHDYLRKLV